MNKLVSMLAVVPVAALLFACGDGSGGGAASGSAAAKPASSSKPASSAKPADTTATDSAKPADSAAAPAGDVLPEMVEFMGMMKGGDKDVGAAFKKFAKAGVEDKDMSMYTLHDGKVTKTEKKDKQTCYEFESDAGMMKYMFAVCWEGGKIVSVESKGSK